MLKKHGLALSSLLRTIARLPSRIDWLRDGDANTALFHLHSQHWKRKNFIPKLVANGNILTRQEDKEQAAFDFYNSLLGTAEQRDISIYLEQLELPPQDIQELDAFFTKEEVWETIKGMPSDKAPRPDGFTGRFYKSCWPIIKSDIMAALIAVQCGNTQNLWMLNSVFLTLIPKKKAADQVKDFRPISLIHSFAKLVTKILANQLARKLHDLVANNQSVFVKGRCIQDNFMLVQQTARFFHQQKLPRILLKLDITNAFDSVSWPFLLEVLRHQGFRDRWCSIISGILFSSSTKILLTRKFNTNGDCDKATRCLLCSSYWSWMFLMRLYRRPMTWCCFNL